ncbi:MAG: hypothetical protein ACREMK_10510 [Gemmatimonadota bacterium]
MRCFPASTLLLAALATGFAACEREADQPPGDLPGLPFSDAVLPTDSFYLVSEIGDTLSFRTSQAEAGTRLARYRRVQGGVDSLVAFIEPRSKAPVSSFQHRHLQSGSVTARVLYGRGFDGQARLITATEEGQREDNVRTPPPVLDAAQIPLSLAALRLADADSLSFNYLAPFERQALAARLVVTGDTLETASGSRRAWRLRLLVSGLEERYWLDAEPPHRLLRIEEVTRSVTWNRP